MIAVEKFSEDIREEGLNYGLPTLFVKLGLGAAGEFQPESLVREIYLLTKCRWICFIGGETTQVGMGTLIKGLSTMGLQVEVEARGDVKDPGWLHTADRWIIDYVENGLFNLGALRSQDMIRFTIEGDGDLAFTRDKMEELKMFPGTKVLKAVLPMDKKLLTDILVIARQYDRCRVYKV